METPSWLTIARGNAPLILSIPHTGTEVPADVEANLVSLWRARKDADWWVDRLYDFAPSMGATIIRTAISRTAIDVNRDPTGKSLYPGQTTTELCPTTTFEGEPLYRDSYVPTAADIARRRVAWFDPYHKAVAAEINRLKRAHGKVVLFDAHSIRSRLHRLFEGELPHLNFGTNSGASCAPELTGQLEALCENSKFSRVTDKRFKGGYITRNYGQPARGVHAIQLELAMRAYAKEPSIVSKETWPPAYDHTNAAPLRAILTRLLERCIHFAAKEPA